MVKKTPKEILLLILILLLLIFSLGFTFLYSIKDNDSLKMLPNYNSGSSLSSSDIFYADTDDNAWGVYVEGDYAYVADGISGLAVINISDPTNPVTLTYANTNGEAHGVYVEGDYVYVADGISGLAIINISDPTNPHTPIYADNADDARDVYIEGNYAYLADGDSGLAVIKIGEIIDPDSTIRADTLNFAYGVYVEGDYAYVASGTAGLAVINISDPTNPITLTYADTDGDAWDVYVSGDYAYVTDGINGLAIINISDPTNPVTLTYADTTGDAHRVYVEGDYAYVADDISGLAVIDISDPINPITLTYADTRGKAWDVHISGDYAYVAADEIGPYTSNFTVINISDPTNPLTLVSVDIYSNARGICVEGDYAYVARRGYLGVIDISDPTNPVDIASVSLSQLAYDVYVEGDYAYVAVNGGELAIIDISDPTHPSETIPGAIWAGYDVYVEGDHVYVADQGYGLAVIKIMTPWYALNVTTLNQISPDPDYDGKINLYWDDVNEASEYFIYRDTSTITTMTGKTPIATVGAISSYQDTISVNATYYYIIVSGNGRGKSWISNCRSVNVIIDTMPPSDFLVFSPMGWVNDITPTIIGQFYTGLSGVNISTVEYAYSTDGASDPTNWDSVNGVYENSACTDLAENGDTGYIYAKVLDIPFNQESETLNTIRFQATDRGNNTGTQVSATVIQTDIFIESPIGLNVEPNGWTAVNSFNLTWTNPSDLSGIIGVYYKLDLSPVSDTDGTYINGIDITEIEGISVSGGGNHSIYIWLKDNAGNVNATKYAYSYLCYSSPSDGGGGGNGGEDKDEAVILGFDLVIISITSMMAIITILIKKKLFFK